MKKILLCLFAASLLIFTGCNTQSAPTTDENAPAQSSENQNTQDGKNSSKNDPGEDEDSAPDVQNTPNATTAYTANTSSRNLLLSDAVSSVTFAQTVYINLTDKTYSADGTSYSAITGTKSSNANEIVADSGILVFEKDSVLTLNSENFSQTLKIILSGTLTSESVALKTSASSTALYLSGVSITSGNYPPVEVKGDVTKLYVVLEGTNALSDGRQYGTGYGEDYATTSENPEDGSDTKGSLYCKGAMIFSGSGSLNITQGYKHGIYSKDYIRVESGTISVTSTGRNGIQCVNGFILENGSITVKGTGKNTNNESRGIIVEGSEDYPGEGFIEIHGGTVNVETYSKGISAKWDIDEDAETSETTDDPYPYVKITGGTVTVKTTGTPKDESSSTYTFTDADGVSVSEKTKLSPEGIEGKQALFISGGELTITTTDDCINASRDGSATLEISGGKIYAYSSNNDALDSNGKLTISGGTIVALTATNPECAFDCDNYTFAITGGTLVGIGTSNYSRPTSSACTQSTFVLSGKYFGAGGKTLAVTDSDGNAVFAYTIPSDIFGTSSKSDLIMILSSPDIKAGTSYNVKTGVTVSGGSSFNNLYTTMPAVSGGTSSVSGAQTSSSDYVYVKSSSTNGGAKEGSHPNPGF